MKKIWILLVVVLVALFFGFREGFSAPGPVPPPYANPMEGPYPLAEVRKVYDRLPQNIRTAQVQKDTQQRIAGGGTMPADRAINTLLERIALVASQVYDRLYKNARAPLSAAAVEADIRKSPPAGLSTEAITVLIEAVKLMFVGKPLPPPGSTRGSGRQSGRAGMTPPPGTRVPPKKADTTNDNVWGPRTTGLGTPRSFGDGGDGNGQYPTLLGPPRKTSGYMTGVGVVGGSQAGAATLPSSASLGSDPLSGFLPFSRQPGDQELIADPYRVAQTYSPASYSSKNEPVPFLTDFSAFQ
jgi:hypothetical protein